MKTLLKYFTLIGIITGLFLPLILWLITGEKKDSFSEYYFTEAKTVFLVSLTIISITFIIHSKKWFIPGIFLLGLTYFNCRDYGLIHNFFAYVFFTYSTILIVRDKRYYKIGYLIIISTPVVLTSIYYFELISVCLITIFHIKYLKLMFKADLL